MINLKPMQNEAEKLTESTFKTFKATNRDELRVIFEAYGYSSIKNHQIELVKKTWKSCYEYIRQSFKKDPSLTASTAPLVFGANIATLSSTPTKTGGGGPSPSKSGSGKKKAKVFKENPEFVLSELERIN